MKYVVSWTYHWNGSAAENEAGIERALQVLPERLPGLLPGSRSAIGRDGSGYSIRVDHP